MAKVKINVTVKSKNQVSVMTFDNTLSLLGFLARTPKAKVNADKTISLG